MSHETIPLEDASTEGRTVFVDFDHTLFAGNSTEMFIARCRPMLVTAVVEFLLRRCIPWRRLRSNRWHSVRDYVCVAALVVLMPWNLLLWRAAASELYRRHRSRPIEADLDGVDARRIVVISFGMSFLIGPLLRETRFRDSRLIAVPGIPGTADLFSGKRDLALLHMREERVRDASFLTDSEDDRDLLAFCRDGRLIERQGPSEPCHRRLYLPFRYLLNAKYRSGYVIDQTLLVDLPIFFIATMSAVPGGMLPHLGTCLLLLMSQLCVYEIGYFENDMVAAKKELRPTLTSRVFDYADYPCHASAWIWSCLFYAGSVLVGVMSNGGSAPSYSDGISWILCLLALRAVFALYNRSPTGNRVYLYPVLQSAKYLIICFYLGCNALGPFLVASQVATMWMNYSIYRTDGKIRREFLEVFRSTIVAVSVACHLMSDRVSSPLGAMAPDDVAARSWTLAILVAWCALRVLKRPVLEILRNRSLEVGKA